MSRWECGSSCRRELTFGRWPVRGRSITTAKRAMVHVRKRRDSTASTLLIVREISGIAARFISAVRSTELDKGHTISGSPKGILTPTHLFHGPDSSSSERINTPTTLRTRPTNELPTRPDGLVTTSQRSLRRRHASKNQTRAAPRTINLPCFNRLIHRCCCRSCFDVGTCTDAIA